MNDIRKKWCEELRSGHYQQTREYLMDGNGYCCLGVLCDIAYKLGIYNIPLDAYDNLQTERLPEEIMKAADITYDICKDLACRNDNGRPFDKIADLIEQLPETKVAEV